MKFNIGMYAKHNAGIKGNMTGVLKGDIKGFRFLCGKCNSNDLTHLNWYDSKEFGEELIIGCCKCQSQFKADYILGSFNGKKGFLEKTGMRIEFFKVKKNKHIFEEI